uniref:Uncharacterized protein n=1 Tax=Ceratitis capitata TaxID=7213 RepID=W8C631_CERCA
MRKKSYTNKNRFYFSAFRGEITRQQITSFGWMFFFLFVVSHDTQQQNELFDGKAGKIVEKIKNLLGNKGKYLKQYNIDVQKDKKSTRLRIVFSSASVKQDDA